MQISYTPHLPGQFAGGEGTEENPYLISTAAELNEIRNYSNNHFELIADIDLGDAPWNEGAGWLPIGYFNGSLNGNGYAIRNLFIDSPDEYGYTGLFYSVGSKGEIRNVKLEEGTVTGRYATGALIGSNSGTVNGCYSSVTVEGYYSTGGLVGENRGLIIASHTSGSVVGNHYAGGMTGKNTGTVESCYTTGFVRGSFFIGGLTGVNMGTITTSYTSGEVAAYDFAGGLVGENMGAITACYSIAIVHDTTDSGCIGGLIGDGSRNPVVSFWDIEVSGLVSSGGGRGIGTDRMKSIDTFRDTGWFEYDWVMYEGDYPRLVWEGTGAPPIPAPEPIPLLGSGTASDPYRIGTAAEFEMLSWHIGVFEAHIVLMNDIDCEDITLYPIGDLGIAYSGVFDGQGYVIRNVIMNYPGRNYVGVFTELTSDGVIRNLGLEELEISGQNIIGGLVGSNSGLVENCYVMGNVLASEGSWLVGGLAGWNNGTITESYSKGKVEGSHRVGGLVGLNWEGTVTKCYTSTDVSGRYETGGLIGISKINSRVQDSYSRGPVTAECELSAGGLIGTNRGSVVVNSYSTGEVTRGNAGGGLVGWNNNVASVSSSFWDMETSKQTTSDGGAGRTTEDMIYPYAANTYVGWNFDSIWQADSSGSINDGYPYFRWRKVYSEPNFFVTLFADPEYGGAVNGGGIYREGDTIRVTAEPAEGFLFAGWTFEEESMNDEYSLSDAAFDFIMPASNLTVTAYFEAASPSIPVLVSPDNGAMNIAVDTILVWNHSDYALSYHLQLSNDPDFSASIIDTNGIDIPSFEVNHLEPSTMYYWRVRAENAGGNSEWSIVMSFTTMDLTSLPDPNDGLPVKFMLSQNYPNPFNPTTKIIYSLSERSHVRLSVYDTLGKLVAELISGEQEIGYHEIIFDASDLPSGMYIYRLRAGEFVESKKLLYIR